jgi:hypothetical protein
MPLPIKLESVLDLRRPKLSTISQPSNPDGRVPRIARLMALAIRFDGLVGRGAIGDYSALARVGHVSRARITQIMNLLLLAPDIQEDILFLPATHYGRDPIHLAQLQPIAAHWDWQQQRRLWQALLERSRQSSRISSLRP